MAVTGAVLAAPASAADPYNATAAGFPGNTLLVNLASSSTRSVVVSNLPANAGLYVIHCKTPADPRQAPTLCDSSTGTLYVLGSGRDSANPAYLRVWPTMFLPVRPDRKTDIVTSTLSDKTVAAGRTPSLTLNQGATIAVTTSSGLVPSLSSDKCSVAGGKITALASTGTCTLLITTTGGKNYKPVVNTQVFQLV